MNATCATHFYGSKQFRHFVCCLCIGAYGCGIYLTNEFELAMTDASKGESEVANVFICSTLTGSYCLGTRGLTEAPPQNAETGLQFDCTVNDVDNPTKFCFFSDCNVLSRYLLVLRRINPRLRD